jgi:hypothetical protein
MALRRDLGNPELGPTAREIVDRVLFGPDRVRWPFGTTTLAFAQNESGRADQGPRGPGGFLVVQAATKDRLLGFPNPDREFLSLFV